MTKKSKRESFEVQRKRQWDLNQKHRQENQKCKQRFAQREKDFWESIATQAGITPMVSDKDMKTILAGQEQLIEEHAFEQRRLWAEQTRANVAELRRGKKNFDVAFAKYLKSGFQEAYAQRSSLHFKYATSWEENASEDIGPGVSDFVSPDEPTARAGAGFEVINDPVFGSFVNKLHPYAWVDVGDSRRGEVEASARPVLTFTHPAPERNVWCTGLSLGISLSGYGFASSSDAIFPSQALALEAGSSASLTMSIRVMQEVFIRGEREDFQYPVVENEYLMDVVSRGAYWIIPFTFIVINLASDPQRQELSYLAGGNSNQFGPWIDYSLRTHLYGAGNFPGSIYQGQPIRIEIEFNLQAQARYRRATGAVRFDQPGLGIRIRDIVLNT